MLWNTSAHHNLLFLFILYFLFSFFASSISLYLAPSLFHTQNCFDSSIFCVSSCIFYPPLMLNIVFASHSNNNNKKYVFKCLFNKRNIVCLVPLLRKYVNIRWNSFDFVHHLAVCSIADFRKVSKSTHAKQKSNSENAEQFTIKKQCKKIDERQV